MIIIVTKNDFLPIKYQKSNYPTIINTMTTLNNLDITRSKLENNINYPTIYDDYVSIYFISLFEYYLEKKDIQAVFVEEIAIFKNALNKFNLTNDLNCKIIEIKESISQKELEDIINENTNN